jgi:hypothetical protein
MREETISLIALPQGEVGEQVSKTIRLWHKLGLIEDGVLIPAEELTEAKVNNFEIGATQISDPGSFFPLFQFLGETPYARRDLVVPWYIGDIQPSLELASVGALLAQKIRISVAKVQSSRSSNETFFATLLSIPSYSEVKPLDIRSGEFYFAKYDLNAMASSEIKAAPGASSVPVKQGWTSFIPFVSAQIITAAGLWKGNPFPLTQIVGRFGSSIREGEGKVVVFRSMTSAVVARNLARKMVSKALQDAGNPEINPFQGGDNRPRSLEDGSIDFMNPYFEPIIELINGEESTEEEGSGQSNALDAANETKAPEEKNKRSMKLFSRSEKQAPTGQNVQESKGDVNIIDRAINDVAAKIMHGFETTFDYERRPELKHRDFHRGAKEVLKVFWDFSVATFKSMPYYIRLWFDRKFAKLMDKLFGYVRQVKEKYFGLEEELLQKIDRISDLRSESRKLDNLVLASAAFEENSRLWKDLRNVSFASLDLKIDDKIGQENRVFPHYKYIATDPDARYTFDSDTATLLEVAPEIDFDKSHETRAKLLEVLNSTSREISETKAKIEELKKPTPAPLEVADEVVAPEETVAETDSEIEQNSELESDATEQQYDTDTVSESDQLPEIQFEESEPLLPEEIDAKLPGAELTVAEEESNQNIDTNNSLQQDKLKVDEPIQDDSLSRFLSFGDDEEKK